MGPFSSHERGYVFVNRGDDVNIEDTAAIVRQGAISLEENISWLGLEGMWWNLIFFSSCELSTRLVFLDSIQQPP